MKISSSDTDKKSIKIHVNKSTTLKKAAVNIRVNVAPYYRYSGKKKENLSYYVCDSLMS